MLIQRGYKVELDPNNAQRTFFKQCAGTARFVYNWGLADRQGQFKAGIKTGHYDQRGRFTALKREQFPWIVDLPYAIIEKAFADLDAAFKHYWRQKKDGTVEGRIANLRRNGKWESRLARLLRKGRKGIEIDPGYPRFKRKGDPAHFSLRNTKIESDQVRLTGIGWVQLKEHGYIPTDGEYGCYATISERAGHWFISVLVEEEIEAQPNTDGDVLGIDLGIKSLAVCSDGTVFENPKALYQAERKLKRLQRELSRRTKGGQNWNKTKRKIQRCHYQIACIRKHALHQVSHYVTAKAKPRIIVIEDLNVSGMTKNHHLAKAVSDSGMSELRRQIEYKAKWYGVQVAIADRWFPSSKTCSECGATNKLLTLSDRTFICPACGCIIDRDLNAALNLEHLAA